MLERRIYSDPRAPRIELHSAGLGSHERDFHVIENGQVIDSDFKIPKDVNILDFIQGFFAGCTHMKEAGIRQHMLKHKV